MNTFLLFFSAFLIIGVLVLRRKHRKVVASLRQEADGTATFLRDILEDCRGEISRLEDQSKALAKACDYNANLALAERNRGVQYKELYVHEKNAKELAQLRMCELMEQLQSAAKEVHAARALRAKRK